MEEKKKLPVGIENFDKIRTEDFYYVDKTGLIEDLLKNWGEVNLFTRPRRFGKSLNMSMLRHFFEPGCDKTLFEGLKISENPGFCEKYMGQYPVISVSLKGVLGGTYETAGRMLNRLINEEAYRIQSRMQWEKLPVFHQKQMKQLLDDWMDEDTQMNALRTLASVMHQYYGQKVIILIDEYEFCAIMGLCNLPEVETHIASRKAKAEQYRTRLLNEKPLHLPGYGNPEITYNYGYFPVRFLKKGLRDQVYDALRKQNIYARKYFYPLISDAVCFRNRYQDVPLPNAHEAAENILTLPLYPELDEEDQERIVDICQEFKKCFL